MSGAARVLERCDILARISEEPGRLTRRFGTPAMRDANELVAGWMREAGLATRVDAVGNLIGRRGDGPALMLGSHLDTVVDAGRYDGPLGVLVALEAVERVPGAIEVVGFADEEGVRFGTAYLGSSAMAGHFDPAWLDLRDDQGVRLGDLVDEPGSARDDVLAYVEVHIEQGPVLERLGEPVGAVTAIAGQSHAHVRFDGEAAHAGTVPMDARRDALVAAAEFVLAVEQAGIVAAVGRRERGPGATGVVATVGRLEVEPGATGVVATVGRLEVEPGVRNVIPAVATLSLDVRGADDDVRRDAVAGLRERARAIAQRRRVQLTWEDTADVPAVAMANTLTEAWGVATRLPSGAGHDAAMMASIVPAAMLFVRCRGGISHNPAESVDKADVAVAIDALERVLRAV